MKISPRLISKITYTRTNKYAKYGERQGTHRELKGSERKSEINVSKKGGRRGRETCNERENMLISRPVLYIWK